MNESTNTSTNAPAIPRDWWRIIGIGVVAAAAVIASFHAQAGLGELAGWHAAIAVAGIKVSLSWLLPLCVDAYGATATRIAVDSARYSTHTRQHALVHAIAAIVVGVIGNAVYHLLAAGVVVLGSSLWILVVGVSVIPPVALGALAHLMALCARDDDAVQERPHVSAPVQVHPAAAVPGGVPGVGTGAGYGRGDAGVSASVREHPPASAPVQERPAEGAVPAAPGGGYGGFRIVPDHADSFRHDPELGARMPHAAPSSGAQDLLGEGQARLEFDAFAGQPDDTGSFRIVDSQSAAAAPGSAQMNGIAPAAVPEPVELHLRAIQTYGPEIAGGDVPSVRRIKKELGCGQPKAQQVQAYLSEYATG